MTGSLRTTFTVAALGLLALVLGGPTPALAQDWTGNVNFFLGSKSLDENDWDPLERQGEIGAEVTFGRDTWPIQLAIDVFGSAKEEDTLDLSGPTRAELTGVTGELDVGVRKIWVKGSVRPYVGGGIAFLSAYRERKALLSIDDSDSTAGLWVGGGVFWRLGSRFNIGGALRLSGGEVNLFGSDIQAGGVHIGLLLGWGWPATP